MGSRVMVLAGGTGGHVYPALAVARELLSQGHEVVWMGTRTGLEARLVPDAGIPVQWLAVAGLRGKGWRSTLAAPFMLAKALAQALAILRRVRPNVVLGMGGFVSGPGGLVARGLGIPLVLHEQNRIPGTTNRWLARWASVVLEAFPDSFPAGAGARCTGNPLRPEIANLARKVRSRPGDPLRVLVLGGSQGARALNEVVPEGLAATGARVTVRHMSGEAMRAETARRYAALGIDARVEAYIDDMAETYAWADLAVCRAGAMTVSELSAAGLPAVLIPFPHAIDDHQTQNARFLADAGAGVLLPQTELTAERLAAEIQGLIADPSRLPAMAGRSASLARPEAAPTVARICLEAASSNRRREDLDSGGPSDAQPHSIGSKDQ